MNPDPASLANLRDLALPASVPWWPPAPGWWILGAGLAAACIVAMWRRWRRFQADAYRREARRQLDAIARRVHAGVLDGAAGDLAAVLKRAALAAFPRKQVASVTGVAWLSFLDRTGHTSAFTEGAGRWLSKWAYATDPSLSKSTLTAALAEARRWVATHERSGGSDRC